jgi:hypothetical protein
LRKGRSKLEIDLPGLIKRGGLTVSG